MQALRLSVQGKEKIYLDLQLQQKVLSLKKTSTKLRKNSCKGNFSLPRYLMVDLKAGEGMLTN
jgi:hypothetical protein